ncbi:YicC/YloC family endoribonuclease [Thioalkalivibrio sp. XN279]|uniref:YicC/YloC family endoribonuclease n=1 Tax=Thioalkalivibrio sp. XN279 TaxID=2714953 RepID=UPI00140C7F49|nr:YicC/YloC family endoribonuclease [Thioalkalivibrio sp. XN279]NHA13673.1 YicC family protein [Thioalkalivibrio sp. XN279]
MIRSMTGFSRIERDAPWGTIAWELRAVNHRYLEIGLRLPEELRALEGRFRQQVAAQLKRGKIDASLRLGWHADTGRELALDLELAARVVEAAQRVRERNGDLALPGAMDILRWPGVVREQERDMEPLAELAAQTLAEALEALDASRRREGEHLAAALAERCAGVAALAEEVRAVLPDIRDGLRTRLLERLEGLEVEFEPQRLEQELALQLGKMDVDEELDRLAAHVAEVRRILSSDAGEANGRRLDFLMQEFNREANTLGSKSVDAHTTRLAVELKVLIEQMREQVQNVE